MFDFHEKRKIRSLVYSKISIGIIVILAVLLSISTAERYSAERAMYQKRAEAEAELEALKLRAATLETQVNHLDNERGIEEELRSRFDVAKEGEQVVIIIDNSEEGKTKNIATPSDTKGGVKGFLSKFKFW
jgi:cell division protein FtsB